MKATLMAAAAVFLAAPLGMGQALAQQHEQQEPETAQRPENRDPIQELQLTPEQRQQIRAIRQALADERARANQQLVEANRLLEELLDSDNPDDAAIEQRLRELNQARAAQVRIRVLQEVRIRRVLTPEQRALLRDLRLAGQRRRERQRELQRRRREAFDNLRRGRGQSNSLTPTPRRPDAPRSTPQP